jgi:hypothetical protein
MVSPQSNLACIALLYATLIQHGLRQRWMNPLNVDLACAGSFGELKTRHGFPEEKWYRGPSRADFR